MIMLIEITCLTASGQTIGEDLPNEKYLKTIIHLYFFKAGWQFLPVLERDGLDLSRSSSELPRGVEGVSMTSTDSISSDSPPPPKLSRNTMSSVSCGCSARYSSRACSSFGYSNVSDSVSLNRMFICGVTTSISIHSKML